MPRLWQAGAGTYSPSAGSHARDGQRERERERWTPEELQRRSPDLGLERRGNEAQSSTGPDGGTKICKAYSASTRDKSNPAPAEAKMSVTNCKSEKRPVLRSPLTDWPDNWPRRCCARYQGLNGDKPEAKSVLRIAKFGPAAEISTLSNFGSDLQP